MEEHVIDLADALDRVQDDTELLLELFDIFEADFKEKRKEMNRSLEERDTETLKNVAHSLKGAAGNISAKRVYAVCLQIEQGASEDQWGSLPEKLRILDDEFQRYQAEAARIKSEYQMF